jgi:hypothetical protein
MGFEPATPTLAIGWSLFHASPPVSPVPLSCAFLALLPHPSHQIAGVDSISLLSRHGRPIPRRKTTTQRSVPWARRTRRGKPRSFPFRGTSTSRWYEWGDAQIRKVIAMPARRSKTKSATRKTAARKTTVAARRPAARRKPAAKKATTRRKTAARRKPAAKTSEQLGAPPPLEPMMPVADPSLIREEPMPQPASHLPEGEEAEEPGLSMDFSEREETGKDS